MNNKSWAGTNSRSEEPIPRPMCNGTIAWLQSRGDVLLVGLPHALSCFLAVVQLCRVLCETGVTQRRRHVLHWAHWALFVLAALYGPAYVTRFLVVGGREDTAEVVFVSTSVWAAHTVWAVVIRSQRYICAAYKAHLLLVMLTGAAALCGKVMTLWVAGDVLVDDAGPFFFVIFFGIITIAALVGLFDFEEWCSRDRAPAAPRGEPEERSTLISWVFFWWIVPTLRRGWRRGVLEMTDLPQLPWEDTPARLQEQFRQAWAAELQRAAAGRRYRCSGRRQRPSLIRVLHGLTWRPLYAAGILSLFYRLFSFAYPPVLQALLIYVQNVQKHSASTLAVGNCTGAATETGISHLMLSIGIPHGPPQGYTLVMLLVLAILLQWMMAELQWFLGVRVQMNIRSVLLHAIYRHTVACMAVTPTSAEPTTGAAAAAPALSRSQSRLPPPPASGVGVGAPAMSTGTLVNLLATDAPKVTDNYLIPYLHAGTWGGALCLAVVLQRLIALLGPAALVGFGVMLVVTPVTLLVSRVSKRYVESIQRARGERGKNTAKIFDAIVHIKLLRLERHATITLAHARRQEMRSMLRLQILTMINMFLGTVGPLVVTTVSLWYFAAVCGRTLDAATAFTALAWFNLLQDPLSAIPTAIAAAIDAYVSLKRIERYLHGARSTDHTQEQVIWAAPLTLPPDLRRHSRDGSGNGGNGGNGGGNSGGNHDVAECRPRFLAHREAELDSVLLEEDDCKSATSDMLVGMDGASFSWPGTGGELAVANVTLHIPRGRDTLTLILGPVGSGKSTLVAGLCGTLQPVDGHATVFGESLAGSDAISIAVAAAVGGSGSSGGRPAPPCAYVAQTPWLRDATVKSNILFGQPFEQARYSRVVQACALGPDLDQLPQGDETRIGDMGCRLSVGQQHRVALARAVYSRAELYVLDNVLSAVDVATRSHIWRHVIAKPLKLRAGSVAEAGYGSANGSGVAAQEEGARRGGSSSREDFVGEIIDRLVGGPLREHFATDLLPCGSRFQRDSDEGEDGDDDGKAAELMPRGSGRIVVAQPWQLRGLFDPPLALMAAREKCMADAGESGSAEAGADDIGVCPALPLGQSGAYGEGLPQHRRSSEMASRFLEDQVDTLVILDDGGHMAWCGPPRKVPRRHLGTLLQIYDVGVAARCTGGDDSCDSCESPAAACAADAASGSAVVPSESKWPSVAGGSRDGGRATHGAGKPESGNSRQVKAEVPGGRDREAWFPFGFEERRKAGNLSCHDLMVYARAFGGAGMVVSLVLVMLIYQVAQVGGNVWLSRWANSNTGCGAGGGATYRTKQGGVGGVGSVGGQPRMSTLSYVRVYAALAVVAALATLARQMLVVCGALRASTRLYNRMVRRVMVATMEFFDLTPTGSLMNRFLHDQCTMDQRVPQSLAQFGDTVMRVVSIVVVIAITTPLVLAAIPAIGIPYYFITRLYRYPARDLRRLESVARSPVLAQFTEMLRGRQTVRAFRAEGRFLVENIRLATHTARSYYAYWASNCWLTNCLEVTRRGRGEGWFHRWRVADIR